MTASPRRRSSSPPRVRIRPLKVSDYEGAVDVWLASGLGYRPRGRDSRSQFSSQLRRNRGRYLGAFAGRELVGVVLATHDTRKGWINRLAVRPEWQRKGVATALVRRAERALRKEGMLLITAMTEEDNPGSVAFFRKLGYEDYPVRYLRKKRRKGA